MRLPTLNRYRCAGALVAGLLSAAMATGAMAWDWPWAHAKKAKHEQAKTDAPGADAAAAGQASAPADGTADPATGATAAQAAKPAASTGDTAAASPEASARTQEIYAKNVDRVKNIKALFGKLRQQVEATEQAEAPLPGGGTYDLPPEAFQVEGEAALDTGDGPPDDQGEAEPTHATHGKKHGSTHAAAAAGGEGVHVVQKGDTLGKIARKYFGTPKKAAAIAAANNITVQTPLKLGQELVIPGADTSSAGEATLGAQVVGSDETASKPRTKHASTKKERRPKNLQSEPVLDYSNYEFKMYLIKAGDSLTRIAKQFYSDGGGVDLIKKYNNLGGESIVLRPGAKLLIPIPKKKKDDRIEQAKKGTF